MTKKTITITLLSLALLGSTMAQNIVGKATYYADKFHGRKTSNGEIYNKHAYTAAHLKLPFGTQLLVRNPRNGKEVVVTVNDRGPYNRHAVLDLSRAAARELGTLASGIAPVEITILGQANSNEALRPGVINRFFAKNNVWEQATNTATAKEGKTLTDLATPFKQEMQRTIEANRSWHAVNEMMTAKK
ncbi:MAG: septal ring lytic transglycosylase RlpA family protein [Bacteroidales bacterium]|nr:septal ring lytic transglycosylase RlpA family protein [Bacteroidales bacterium]